MGKPVVSICLHPECSKPVSHKSGKYCSNACFLAVRWKKFADAKKSQKTIKCICLCGCGRTVSPSTVKKPVVYATKPCRGNKAHLVAAGIIPEYRRAKLRGMGLLAAPVEHLKKCRNPECQNRVKANIRYYCSRECSLKSRGKDLKLALRKYAPEGYLSFLQRNFIYDKLVKGDKIALQVLRQLNVTRVYHRGIDFNLIKGERIEVQKN